MGSTESQSTGRRTLIASGSIAAARAPLAGSADHSIATAPEVKPAPKATKTIRSPTLMRPESTASARARGTDAAEVFPKRSTLTKIRSIGKPRPLATASMIRMLAWWGMTRSISSGWRPARSIAASAVDARVFVAKR